MSRSPRILLSVLALTATTGLLTSCQDDDSGGGKAENAAAASPASPSASQPAETPDDTGSASARATGSSGEGDGGSGGHEVTGTWHGTVTYMAPGKYMVKDAKAGDQAFLTSTKTDILGAQKICGDGGQSATRCTAAQLEAASRKGFPATVTLHKGVATKVAEDHPAGGGTDQEEQPKKVYWEGVSHYLAPGKYSVTDDGTKKERAFLTSSKTVINGNGWICGTREKTKRCTTAQLDAATKRGERLVVKIADDGTAVTIDEQHN
ncbi:MULTISPECIES: hypothetical protein [Streptomyces]|uniref:Lipoprotein n=1 Tax=Streptomyces evansiae TaxID=3075535 RepID=A0ABD5ED62_9ACTN|nr:MULTISPECIES: hypothetical protein [unclassified Streptomyces]MDT0419313.1 hypothetical protein [Streptomyces sp. DSM 41982]